MQTNAVGIGTILDDLPPVNVGAKYHRPTCELCDDLGMIITRDKFGRNVTRPCSCGLLERTQEKRLFEDAKIPRLPTPFSPCPDAQKYVGIIKELPRESSWILFSGRAGSGKTSNASWIAIEFITRYHEPARFYSAYSITRKLATTKGIERFDVVNEIVGAPFIVIDDFLKVFPRPDSFQYSDYFEATLEILWGRYEKKLPTCVTTQKSFNELTTFDAALAGRIAESCRDRVVLFDRNARNWRL